MASTADKNSSPHPSLNPMLAVGPRLSGTASDSNTSSTTHDIVLWAFVIPSISLALFVRSLFTTLREAPAAASDLPPSILQLFHVNAGITQLLLGCLLRFLTTLIMSAAFTAAAWLAPSWYLQGGREQLLTAARLVPKAITVLQLLLLPSGPLGELERVWLQTCTVGAKGLLALMVWPLLFPTSVRSYLKVAPLECGLALAADVMFTLRTSSPLAFPPLTRIATMALLYAVCGFALPAALLTFSKHLRRSRCQQPAPQAAPCVAQATRTSAPGAAAPNLKRCPCPPPAPPPASPGVGEPLACCVGHIALSRLSSGSLGGIAAPTPQVDANATARALGNSRLVLYHSPLHLEALHTKMQDARASPRHEATPASLSPHPGSLHMDGALRISEGSPDKQLPAELLHLSSGVVASAGWLQWAPICWEAGSAEEVVVELTLASVVGAVEALVQYRQRGEQAVEKLATVDAVEGSNARVRLLLPPGLDTGPVAIHLLSTQEGRKGVLLGSATTMALPAAAANEVLQACAASSGFASEASVPGPVASAEDHQDCLRHLLRDIALLWQLHGTGASARAQQRPAPSTVVHGVQQPACSTSRTVGSAALPPSAAVLEAVLRHLAESGMLHCHALLAARCSVAAAAGEQLPAPVQTTSSETATTTTTTATSTSASAAFSTAPAGPASQSEAVPVAEPSPPRPSLLSWARSWGGPASWLQRLAAASSDPGYSAWRLQRVRKVDGTAWMALTATTLAGQYLLDDVAFGGAWFWSVAVVLLHFAPAVVAHVLLAVAGERQRGSREEVVLVFAAAKAAACVAAVLASARLPGPFKALWSLAPVTVLVHRMFRPCLLQGSSRRSKVLWREQLLASAIEELPKYAALTSSLPSGPGSAEPTAPVQVYARIGLAVVVLAGAVSRLVEGLYLHEYASAAATGAAAAQACSKGNKGRSSS